MADQPPTPKPPEWYDPDTDTWQPRPCHECHQAWGSRHLEGCTGQFHEDIVTTYFGIGP